VTIPGAALPVKLSSGRSVQRMFRGSADGQEIDLSATDHMSVLVREALHKEIARLRRRPLMTPRQPQEPSLCESGSMPASDLSTVRSRAPQRSPSQAADAVRVSRQQ
jgi:hypothetical protein